MDDEQFELGLPDGWWVSVTLIFVIGFFFGALMVGALWWIL